MQELEVQGWGSSGERRGLGLGLWGGWGGEVQGLGLKGFGFGAIGALLAKDSYFQVLFGDLGPVESGFDTDFGEVKLKQRCKKL